MYMCICGRMYTVHISYNYRTNIDLFTVANKPLNHVGWSDLQSHKLLRIYRQCCLDIATMRTNRTKYQLASITHYSNCPNPLCHLVSTWCNSATSRLVCDGSFFDFWGNCTRHLLFEVHLGYLVDNSWTSPRMPSLRVLSPPGHHLR